MIWAVPASSDTLPNFDEFMGSLGIITAVVQDLANKFCADRLWRLHALICVEVHHILKLEYRAEV